MPINSFLYPGAKFIPAYEVANSVRFNDGDSPRLVIANPSAGTRTKGTFSTWFKRCTFGANQYLFSTWNNSTSGYSSAMILLQSDDRLSISNYVASGASGGSTLITERKFRDPSAWYHVVIAWDTTDSTEADRYKIYVNGTRETTFNGTPAYPTSNQDLFFQAGGTSNPYHIGFESVGSDQKYFDGYLAETVLVDGSALAASSFGEFDSDSPRIWKPIDISGLTFGSQGFYLDYEDSGDLGDDESGNGNDFAETNLAATDQSTDTCTNNFATMNPLIANSSINYSEGNLKVSQGANSNYMLVWSNFAVNKGKWYVEFKAVSGFSSIHKGMGYVDVSEEYGNTKNFTNYNASGSYNASGRVTINTSQGSDYTSYTNGAIVGIALDLDNNKVYYHNAGTYINSGDPTSGSTGTGAFAVTSGKYYVFATTVIDFGGENVWEANFGSPAYSISSGNADGNGYGNFEYAVPANYYSLCTKNLGGNS